MGHSHSLNLLLHPKFRYYSCPVGTGIVLEHCISSHVSLGGSQWDKKLKFMDVAMCIQVSIDNYQLCFACVTHPSPHHDATSVERPDWLQATSCMSLAPVTPNKV